MGMGNAARALLGDPDPRHVRRENLAHALGRDGDPYPLPPIAKDRESEIWELNRQVGEEISGSPLFYDPEGIVADAARQFGLEDSVPLANKEIAETLLAEGRKTTRLRGTMSGKSPTVIVKGKVMSQSPRMGAADNVAMTYGTPRQWLENLTGNTDQADRIETRLDMRNQDYGEKDAAVWKTGNFKQDQRTPWMLFRDLKDGFLEEGGLHGYARPGTRHIFMNASRDMDYDRPGQIMATPLNVGQHEMIHAILHGQNPSIEHLMRKNAFNPFKEGEYELNPNASPAVLGINRDNIRDQTVAGISTKEDEIGNLLFHMKRLTEASHPGMRDVGATEETLKNWLDWVRQYKPTGVDPTIDLPGHPNEGKSAHGLEAGLRMIQEILKNADKDARKRIDDLNWQTGQTPSLSEALLA